MGTAPSLLHASDEEREACFPGLTAGEARGLDWERANQLIAAGRVEEALDDMERRVVERAGMAPRYVLDPRSAPLHGHPRIEALVQEIGIPRR